MNDNRNNAQEELESFSLRNFLKLCLRNWKWFLVSIVLAIGLGLFYVYTRQPVYERSEEILVKDQQTGGGIAEVSGAFSDLGLFSNHTSVNNELIAFTSPAVMAEVVERLDLEMNYNRKKDIRRQTLYGTSMPLLFEFPDISERDNIGFNIVLEPDGSVEIKKIWQIEPSGIVKFKEKSSGKVDGSPIGTPIGKIVVRHNPAYVSDGISDSETQEIEVFRQSKALAIEKYVAKLKGDLSDQDADVINLSIQDTSVERADDILNMVVTVYNERWMEDKNKVAVATSRFISERLDVIRQELGAVDDELAEHKSKMSIPDLEEAAKKHIEQEFLMNQDLLAISNRLAMTTYLKEFLQNPEHQFSILPTISGTENTVLEGEIIQYNDLLIQRNNLAENSGVQNPIVKDRDKMLAGMRSAILRSIDSQIANLRNAMSNIDRAQATNRQELSQGPQMAKSLLSSERQQLVTEQLYLYLLQKREETELTMSFTSDNTRIITPPYGKQKPVFPRKGLFLAVAFILGAGIPAGLLFLFESFNTKIRTKQDLDDLSAPFAGEIPYIGNSNKIRNLLRTKKQRQKEIDKPNIIVSEGKRDVPNEAFRVVRSNIDFMLGRGEHAVLALTSFNPGSGKSFVAYNLGASFALKGKRVLIIDGDLRHGSISTYVHSPRKGLANYLNDEVNDWQALVVRAESVKGLDVLPIGYRPPNPAELLDSSRLDTLIEEAKSQYDLVLIDCPPVNIVVDTQIINQYVYRTLFVIRAGLLEKKAVSEIEKLIQEKKFKNITILLNGTKSAYSSYYSYGNYEAIDKS